MPQRKSRRLNDHRKGLLKAKSSKLLVRVQRTGFEQGHIQGRVVSIGARLVVLAVVNSELWPNGLITLRQADITHLYIPAPHAAFIERVLALREVHLPRFTLSITDWLSVVRGALRRYPLVTVHTEEDDPDTCSIGVPTALTAAEMKLRVVTPGAKWRSEPVTVPWKAVTRVDFGGGYEEALSLVAGGPPKE